MSGDLTRTDLGAPSEGGTGNTVGMMMAIAGAAACLLCGYELVRSASTSLYIGAYTAARLPVVMALTPVAVLLFLYIYGLLLSRFGPARALLLTSGGSAVLMAACYVGLTQGWKPAAGALYLLREAYIVLVLEQYWSLVNSSLTRERAKRWNGPFTGVASLGSILGAELVSRYAQGMGTEKLVLLAAASLVPAGILSATAYLLAGEPKPSAEEAGGRQGHLALRLFRDSRYLVLLACLIALTQVMSTVLELRFSGLVEGAYPLKDVRTAYLGGFWRNLNIAASAMQFIAAPLALRCLPLRVVHGVIPALHLGTCLALLLRPSLATGAAAFMLFKVLDYSVFRAGKEILYIPLSFDVRYRAKEIIDAFVYRFSKGAMGLLTAGAGSVLGGLSGQVYPSVALLAAALWLPLVLRLTRPAQKAGTA